MECEAKSIPLTERNYALLVDGNRVPVESASIEQDGINVTIVLKTTAGAIAGNFEPRLERVWGGFRAHEHVNIRSKPKLPIGGMAQIIGVQGPTHDQPEALFRIKALTPVYDGGKLFLGAGQQGLVPYGWLEKQEAIHSH